MIKALSDTSIDLQLKDLWWMYVLVTAADGTPLLAANPVFTITSPTGDVIIADVDERGGGVYRTFTGVNDPGRWVCEVRKTGNGVANFVAYSSGVVVGTSMPTVDDVRNYADNSQSIGDWDDEDIQSVLDSEASQQRSRCDIGAIYPPDLFEALCRRTVLGLNRRSQLNAGDFAVGIAGTENQAFIPNDPEIRRLETPYKKVVML